MHLYIYPPFLGLPSIDGPSLQFLAAAKFCAAEVTVKYCTKLFESPSGQLPTFVTENDQYITELAEFVEYLRHYHDEIQLDAELADDQKILFDTYAAYLKRSLFPCLEELFWLDEFNYGALMSNWFASRVMFPFGVFYANRRRNDADRVVRCSNRTAKQRLSDGISVLNNLAAKLGESKYFCGNKPSSLDALIVGYLAPLLKLPLANDRLQLHLSSMPNLGLFVESIISIYMPLNGDDISSQIEENGRFLGYVEKAKRQLQQKKADQQLKRAEREKLTKTDERHTKLILFAVATLTVSVVFALHTGIIDVHTEKRDTIRKKSLV